MVARLCPGCAPHKGPLATGLRIQDCLRLTAPGGAPLELDVALGKVRVFFLKDCSRFLKDCSRLQPGLWCLLLKGGRSWVRECLGLVESGVGFSFVQCYCMVLQMFCRSGLEPDDAWGANAELRTDTRQLLGSRYSAPLSLSGSVMGHRAERMAAVSAAMQVIGSKARSSAQVPPACNTFLGSCDS